MEIVAYTVAAVALLGSPGPGIAALVAIGRRRGMRRSLGFFAALQAGLAIAAGLSALGIGALIAAAPGLVAALTAASVAYLLWLAWSTASAPLRADAEAQEDSAAWSPWGGFLLGIANPKAYLAFASLMGSFVLAAPRFGPADTVAKWLVCILVIFAVDIAWLWAGAGIGRLSFSPRGERAMNLAMGGAIAAAAVAPLL